MDPAPEAAPSARTLMELFGDGLSLAKESLPESAWIVAAGVFPSVVLTTLAMLALGLDPAEVSRAVDEVELGRLMPVLFAGLLGKSVNLFAFMALILALDARDQGRALSPREAFLAAKERLGPFLATGLRVVSYTALGFFLLVIPGLVLTARYCLAHLAVLLEGLAGKSALSRSRELVSSHPRKVLGNLLAAVLAVVLLQTSFSLGLDLMVNLSTAAIPGNASLLEVQLLTLLNELMAGLLSIWATAFSILLYKDLAALHPR